MHGSVPKRLLDEAVRFHGHLGAFLVLGLQAGLFANEVLGKDYSGTKAIVETEPSPPCSCFVDGIQVATGCTMGKGNIELKRGDSLSVTFMKDFKRLKLTLKNNILESHRGVSSIEESQKTAAILPEKISSGTLRHRNITAPCSLNMLGLWNLVRWQVELQRFYRDLPL